MKEFKVRLVLELLADSSPRPLELMTTKDRSALTAFARSALEESKAKLLRAPRNSILRHVLRAEHRRLEDTLVAVIGDLSDG